MELSVKIGKDYSVIISFEGLIKITAIAYSSSNNEFILHIHSTNFF